MEYEDFTQFVGLCNYIINVISCVIFKVPAIFFTIRCKYYLPEFSYWYPDNLLSVTSTHSSPMLHFYTLWKRQKIFGFLTFSEDIV